MALPNAAILVNIRDGTHPFEIYTAKIVQKPRKILSLFYALKKTLKNGIINFF